ncbi:acetyltransferase [Spirosoma sp. HMF4905]|uniref:Acetyltransferase n=2 Tax=Spirosoma arboris TaxID=2682092 RepID=A0A7K1SJ69_9BACT|nr:acetyltransferase [Spirosoma arboris]
MNASAYLKRIGYVGWPDICLASLQTLHYQHLLAIPLENLAIHAGIPIRLSVDALFEKIVTQRRGGICYELNGLFYELLLELGFTVKRVSGRTYTAGIGFNPEFDHLALIVQINEIDYLVDIGLGRRFPLYPLRLIVDSVQEDHTGCYRITQPAYGSFMLSQRTEAGLWENVYQFTLTPQELSAFDAMCHYHQTSPASFFTRNKVCTLITEEGRITLTDHSLKRTKNGQTYEQLVTSPKVFDQLLTDYFGMNPY